MTRVDSRQFRVESFAHLLSQLSTVDCELPCTRSPILLLKNRRRDLKAAY